LSVLSTRSLYYIDPFPLAGAASSVSPARSIFSTISIFELVKALSRTLDISFIFYLDIGISRTSSFQSRHPACFPAPQPDPATLVLPAALLPLSSSHPSYYAALWPNISPQFAPVDPKSRHTFLTISSFELPPTSLDVACFPIRLSRSSKTGMIELNAPACRLLVSSSFVVAMMHSRES
jgi:hypothetical protein